MPRVAVMAGINGAGKTTASHKVLTAMGIPVFTNADAIARGLNSLDPEGEAVAAGRVMLRHLDELAAAKREFAFETTLAARTYAGWLRTLKATAGYEVHLYYFWLDGPETAISRVAERVKSGGHHIPSDTIRQRYAKSVRNFFELYLPVVDYWRVYDNSKLGGSRLVAFGTPGGRQVLDGDTWLDIERSADHA